MTENKTKKNKRERKMENLSESKYQGKSYKDWRRDKVTPEQTKIKYRNLFGTEGKN